ncbi:MAG TPA: hypothetical protein VKB19_11330 [Pedobacter sp.]|nr:hypothetical protein [Pedobacter sp.]
MKKLLSICAVVAVVTACQPAAPKNDMVITPTPAGVPSASSAPAVQTAESGQKPVNNPAHGQPFHDCAIAVGAPLASAPAATAAPAVNVTNTPASVPAAVQAQPDNSNKEVKLNPPHGQPGHSCKIAVGAPLT